MEHYNAETGEMLSDEPDYNPSFYIDLIIRQVAGLEPTEDGFEVEPLETGLEWFRLERVMLRGHRVDIGYRLGEGMKVLVDGKCVCCDAVVRKYRHVFED